MAQEQQTIATGRGAITLISSRRSPDEAAEKRRQLDASQPGWRDLRHPNGQPLYDADGTLLDEDGSRSIFDDVDE